MAKEEVVAAQLAAIQSAQTQALVDGLGAVYDQAALDQKAADGTLSQADVDAAVAAAQAVDAQALADATAQFNSDLAAVQTALDDMTAKEAMEEEAVKAVQASIDSVQASFDAIRALFPAAPVTP